MTYTNLMQKYERLVQDKFKVKNPFLLKTGTLGTMINIFANQEMDMINYYNKLFQQTHPALANDFNSLLFHSNFYGVPVEFAHPAHIPVYLQIPRINTEDVYYYEYILNENTEFFDENGVKYIIMDKITIFQDKSKVKAYAYTTEGKKELNIIESETQFGIVYLIEYDNVQQYQRNFYSNVITDYNIGESFYFDIPIDHYTKLYKINSWLNLSEEPLNIYDLKNHKTKEISQIFNLKDLNIKYFDYSSNKFDYDLFTDIKETVLAFKTGDGIRGAKLPAGAQIITEIDLTEGENINTKNVKTILNNVLVKKVNLDKKESFFKTNISLFSVTGGQGGQSFEKIEDLRKKIFNKIQVRNSLLTIADYENAFTFNNIKPFIDSKFLNNNPIVFIFNPFKFNNKTIETLATNISEIDLSTDPFYPTWTPDPTNDKKFISPFYFKRKNENIVDAYIVKPEIEVPLYTSTNIDIIKKLNNEIRLKILYDFSTKKSYLKLEGTKDNYTYHLSCNYFGHIFTFGENFTWEVDSVYTDKYCIIREPLTTFELSILDENGNQVIDWYNKSDSFFQLKKKQEIYKYYKPNVDGLNYDAEKTTVAEEYLDNQLEEILSDIETLYYPIKNDEIPTLLRVPFIDKDFFDTIDYNDFYVTIDSYFQVENNKDNIPISTRLQQSFYNTYDYDSEIFTDFSKYVIKESSNSITKPKIPINLNLVIDQEIFKISNYDSIYDLEFEIKIKITEYLLKKEGFEIEFFESNLESLIINDYYYKDYGRSLIKNIELISPKKLIINNSDTIYYNIKSELGIDKLLSFVPPYFYFDYDNIQINISVI